MPDPALNLDRPSAGLSDAELVRRVRAGETALFELLMRRHNQRVYRTVRSILRGEADAEDAMQQTWLSAYAHLDRFQGAAAFPTWLTRIAVNEALGRLRRAGRLAAVPQGEVEENMASDGGEDPETTAARRQLARMLEREVDALPDGYRTVFVLREIEGLSTAEAAAALDLSDEAVKVRLHRARLALRDALFARAGEAHAEAFPFMGARCDAMVRRVFAVLHATQ